MKWRFAVKFLVTFAALTALWAGSEFGIHYRTAVLAVVQVLSPGVNGWMLEHDQRDAVAAIVFRSGTRALPMQLELPALAMGLLPFVSLVVATPGQSVRRIAASVVVGSLLYFASSVIFLLVYPFIMDRPNAIKDTLGVFSGLIVIVMQPLGLWFVLTYPVLRSLWQLNQEQ